MTESLIECRHCGDGDALRDNESCAYCGGAKSVIAVPCAIPSWRTELPPRTDYPEDESE